MIAEKYITQKLTIKTSGEENQVRKFRGGGKKVLGFDADADIEVHFYGMAGFLFSIVGISFFLELEF